MISPLPHIAAIRGYSVPRPATPVDLRLDGNEGSCPPESLLDVIDSVEALRLYPDPGPFEALVAQRLGLAPRQVMATAGADEAIDRICRALLAPGRRAVLPVPGFEMSSRYAYLAGADLVELHWPEGPYPVEAVIEAAAPTESVVFVTTPNNPTGAIATADDLLRLSAALPRALLVVDLAYIEFADEDLTPLALSLPNAVVTRTLSKAYGLAGARVGYVAGPAEVIEWLRAAGGPYSVAAPSMALAAARLQSGDDDMRAFVTRVRAEREALAAAFAEAGFPPVPSHANFVLARVPDPIWLRDAMAGLGVGIRAFPGRPYMEDAVRIACPGADGQIDRVCHGLRTALRPQAILFDMDGVLADVSGSYRQAIVDTAAAWGVQVTGDDVVRAKEAGDANNDWVLTHRLLAAAGVDVGLAEVTERFEASYQGTDDLPGLWASETLRVDAANLRALAARLPLAIVTGRPRRDAERFLAHHGVADLFPVVVCMEDGPLKPDPAPVVAALARLGVERAWMIGDTVDDIRAARAARVVPLGVLASTDGESTARALIAAGAARVLAHPLAFVEHLL